MERLLIALIVVAISKIFSNKGKENKKRKSSHLPPEKKSEVKKHVPKYSEAYAVEKPKETVVKTFDTTYNKIKSENNKSWDYTNESEYEYEEAEANRGEIFNLGLSELQKAIVMKEILSKPIALREKR